MTRFMSSAYTRCWFRAYLSTFLASGLLLVDQGPIVLFDVCGTAVAQVAEFVSTIGAQQAWAWAWVLSARQLPTCRPVYRSPSS
jgi:hypothetical protein